MIFNSYGFVMLFLPAFLLVMQLARQVSQKRPELKEACKVVVIAFSLAFYGFFGVKNCAVLAASVLVNIAGVLLLSGDKKHKKALLFIVVFINIASLMFFKFSGTFFPVAISFYTFNQISYIVDLYRGDIREFSVIDYLAYVLFFPKILQGPLMGYGDFIHQIEKITDLNAERMLRALFLLSMGLFKKVILADTFGRAVDYGYDNLMSLGSLEAILIAVFYSFQLYFDFSGYCDMAGAVCMMIGFELPDNFSSPYKSVNIVDFWKRWHITLTKFFTRYVYIPLGGNRRGAARMYINFMIVFLLSGLWHGNGWTFIVWGVMHGVLYVVTRAVISGNKPCKGDNTSRGILDYLKRCVLILLTFVYVTVAWVFFRANTVSDAMALLSRIFVGGKRAVSTGISACFQLDELWYVIKITPLTKFSFVWELCMWLFLLGSCAIVFVSRNAIEISKSCKIGKRTTILTALLLVWSIVSFAKVSTFLYMNF